MINMNIDIMKKFFKSINIRQTLIIISLVRMLDKNIVGQKLCMDQSQI